MNFQTLFTTLKDLFSNTITLNTFFLSFGEFFSKLTLFLLTIIIARYLGPAQLGLFSFVYSLVAIFFILSDFGTNTYLNIATLKNKNFVNNSLWNSFVLKFFLSIIALLLLLTFVFLFNRFNLIYYLLLVSLAFVVGNFNTTFISFFRAFEKMNYEMFIRLIKNILFFSLSFYFIFLKSSILGVFFSLFFSNLFAFAISFIFLKRITSLSFTVGITFMKKLLQKSWPYALTSFFAIIYFRSDILMLSLMEGDIITGLYSIVIEILGSLVLFPYFFTLAFFPSLVRYAKSNKLLMSFFTKSVQLQSFLVILLAMFIFLFSKQIILLLFGSSYTQSILALQIIIFALIFIAFNTSLTYLYYSLGYPKIITLIACLGAILNILFNLYLIPLYSLYGAAAATLVTEFIVSLLCIIFLKKVFLKENIFTFIKIIFIIIITFSVYVSLSLLVNYLLTVLMTLVVFILISYCFNLIDLTFLINLKKYETNK